jgi:hypothetical protein
MNQNEIVTYLTRLSELLALRDVVGREEACRHQRLPGRCGRDLVLATLWHRS